MTRFLREPLVRRPSLDIGGESLHLAVKPSLVVRDGVDPSTSGSFGSPTHRSLTRGLSLSDALTWEFGVWPHLATSRRFPPGCGVGVGLGDAK